MKLALLQRLCIVRRHKIERAEKSCRTIREEVEVLERDLTLVQQHHAAMLADKHRYRMAWQAARLELRPFDSGDIVCHEALMARCNTLINQADQLVSVRRMQLEEGMDRLAQAHQLLVQRRMELAKAEEAISRVVAAQRERDEAVEEDELDQIAVMGSRLAFFET